MTRYDFTWSSEPPSSADGLGSGALLTERRQRFFRLEARTRYLATKHLSHEPTGSNYEGVCL